jgi:hypothetical protein
VIGYRRSPATWGNTSPSWAIVDGEAEKAAQLALEHVVGFERAVRAVL